MKKKMLVFMVYSFYGVISQQKMMENGDSKFKAGMSNVTVLLWTGSLVISCG